MTRAELQEASKYLYALVERVPSGKLAAKLAYVAHELSTTAERTWETPQ